MKLIATVKPRADGCVIFGGRNGVEYKFEANEAGQLAGEIADKRDAMGALSTENFYPAAEEDEALAMEWAAELEAASAAASAADDDGDDQDPEEDPNAPPVESNTPPKPKSKATPKAK